VDIIYETTVSACGIQIGGVYIIRVEMLAVYYHYNEQAGVFVYRIHNKFCS